MLNWYAITHWKPDYHFFCIYLLNKISALLPAGGFSISCLLWISLSSIMAAVGLSRPAAAAAAWACCMVRARTAWKKRVSDQSPYTHHHIHFTCIVPIVFSKASFKSPPVLASQAVLKAVNKSPVPTKAAANFGMRTCKTGRVESSTYKLDQPLLQFSCHPWHGWPAPLGGCRYPDLC